MSKNKKNTATAIRFGPALFAFALCLLLGGVCLGKIYLKEQIHRLGRQQRQIELKIENLKRENKTRAQNLALLQSPDALTQRVSAHQIGRAHV